MSTSTDIPQIPQTQKAWLVEHRGEPSHALKFAESAPVPTKLVKGEVLVRVQAAALNPVGYNMMRIAPNWLARRPHVAEYDFSGVVADANGTDLQNGQEVFGFVPVELQRVTHQGALAEYTRVPRALVTPRPSSVSAVEAAGFALAGLTAYCILFDVAQLEPGQSVFINGGSTAVGMYAAQLAKAIGCTVTVAASGPREELLKSLGVDHFIDYTKAPVYEQLEKSPPEPKFHVFVEAVGNTDVELFTHSTAYLAPGGVFISVGPQPDGLKGLPHLARYFWEALLRPTFLGGTRRTWRTLMVKPTQEKLEKFAQYVADGKVKPVVDSIYHLEDALKAYDRIMTKHACGKVVVKVDPEAY